MPRDQLEVRVPDDVERPVELSVLVVEDDVFQQMALRAIISNVTSHNEQQIDLQLTFVSTAAEAVAACKAQPIKLVLLDLQLPGGNADGVLPRIRQAVGPLASIIMLSSAAQESSMQRCWLDLGADSYRVKPVSTTMVAELFTYALQKGLYMRKRQRSPSSGGNAPAAASSVGEGFDFAPGILNLLSQGRRGPVHLGVGADEMPIAMKVRSAALKLFPSPPPHPNVNRVLRRLAKGQQCIEARELCEGGELFDTLISQETGCLPADQALFWFTQLALAVAHCHSHGAVHGQLQTENVLLNATGDQLQVVGFYVRVSPSSPPGRQTGDGEAGNVELRPSRAMEAPELEGRTLAGAEELFACDVWALGMLLVCMLFGCDGQRAPHLAFSSSGGSRLDRMVSSVGGMRLEAESPSPKRSDCAADSFAPLATAMMQMIPDRRPTAAQVLERLALIEL